MMASRVLRFIRFIIGRNTIGEVIWIFRSFCLFVVIGAFRITCNFEGLLFLFFNFRLLSEIWLLFKRLDQNLMTYSSIRTYLTKGSLFLFELDTCFWAKIEKKYYWHFPLNCTSNNSFYILKDKAKCSKLKVKHYKILWSPEFSELPLPVS